MFLFRLAGIYSSLSLILLFYDISLGRHPSALSLSVLRFRFILPFCSSLRKREEMRKKLVKELESGKRELEFSNTDT